MREGVEVVGGKEIQDNSKSTLVTRKENTALLRGEKTTGADLRGSLPRAPPVGINPANQGEKLVGKRNPKVTKVSKKKDQTMLEWGGDGFSEKKTSSKRKKTTPKGEAKNK